MRDSEGRKQEITREAKCRKEGEFARGRIGGDYRYGGNRGD